jgi:hypothetical protein
MEFIDMPLQVIRSCESFATLRTGKRLLRIMSVIMPNYILPPGILKLTARPGTVKRLVMFSKMVAFSVD